MPAAYAPPGMNSVTPEQYAKYVRQVGAIVTTFSQSSRRPDRSVTAYFVGEVRKANEANKFAESHHFHKSGVRHHYVDTKICLEFISGG